MNKEIILSQCAYRERRPAPARRSIFCNTGNNHEGEIIKGHGMKLYKYVASTDHGKTWSAAVDITTQVHRPKQPAVDAAFDFNEDRRCCYANGYYANTPGHAIHLQNGIYRGRVYVEANHSSGAPQNVAGHYAAHGYYSDDHGKTLKLAATSVPVKAVDVHAVWPLCGEAAHFCTPSDIASSSR